MIGTLIAIDPGGARKGCSAVEFSDGVLSGAFARIDHTFRVDRVVVERPQQDGRSRAVPPSVLIDLSWEGAMLAGRFVGANPGCEFRAYSPDDWKGTVAKALHHKDRILPALTCEERVVIEAAFPEFTGQIAEAVRHGALSRWAPHANAHYLPVASRLPDVLDAVGLGLFDLGRIKK